MSDPTTYERLAERFSPAEHKTKTIGGNDLTYVDGETVISRLNATLGFDGWSFETGQINVLENEVWVTGKLTVYVGERTVVREQAGGQIINRTRAGAIIELSNDIKGAVTDCLKKCATLVGVGLYLYDPIERAEVKAEMAAAKRAPRVDPTTRSRPSAATAAPVAASTPAASGAGASSSSTTATPAPSEPTALKTKVELVADLKKGMDYARSLGLDPADVDAARMNRAEIEETIDALRAQCREVLAERRKAQVS